MKNIVIIGGSILLVALWLFSPAFDTNAVLFSTDNNIGSEALLRNSLVRGFGAFWSDSSLVGGLGLYWPNWTGLLLSSLPLVSYVNWIHAIDLCLASVFLARFLIQKGIAAPMATILAVLAAYWIGVNFCLVYAGHTSKFAILMLVSLALMGICETVRRRSVPWAIMSGGALGLAFVEQQDVALFFGIFLGGYAVTCVVRDYGWDKRLMLKLLAPMAIVIVLMAGPPAFSVLKSQTEGVVSGGDESPNAKWEFITQWSQPPDESVEFLAPGYMGWRSGEPEGPYWGRSGRSAGWEKTRQGFMNFRLEALYIGAIPIVFALFALGAALFSGKRPALTNEYGAGWRDRRAEILFWSVVATITIVLAFGKFTPLYWFFYQLPVVNNIRAPVKFLQVFQVALAILAAYGLDLAFEWSKNRDLAKRA